MSWFTGILDYWSTVQPSRTAAVLAAAVEPLEDRRLLSVSCAPPVYCQPRGCNDVPVLNLNNNNGCKPVCNAPTLNGSNGKDCSPKPQSCKPIDWCDGPIGRGSDNCESNNNKGKGKGKDNCRPQKDNDCNDGPAMSNRGDNCESDKGKGKNKSKNKGKDNCESKKDDCRREDRCEQGPLFGRGKDNDCQQGPTGRGGKDNCRPDPCEQAPNFRGGVFCNKPCETKPSCESKPSCDNQSSNRSGKNDCFSKQPCKPVYCNPSPCNVPIPA